MPQLSINSIAAKVTKQKSRVNITSGRLDNLLAAIFRATAGGLRSAKYRYQAALRNASQVVQAKHFKNPSLKCLISPTRVNDTEEVYRKILELLKTD